MLIPIHCASADKVERLSAERVLVGCWGALNPPHLYSLLVGVRGQTKGLKQGLRIFGSQRPLNPVLQNRVKRRVWKEGLQLTSLALHGAKFNGCNAACLAAWNLSPGDWAYVARQIDRLATKTRACRFAENCFPSSRLMFPFLASFFVHPVGGYTKSSEGNAPGFTAASSFVEE